VHGGGGTLGQLDLNELESCADSTHVEYDGDIYKYHPLHEYTFESLSIVDQHHLAAPEDCAQACHANGGGCTAFRMLRSDAVAESEDADGECTLLASVNALAAPTARPHQTKYDLYMHTEGTTQCPTHYTNYHHTSTGCEAYCAFAFGREGNDNTCMPNKPECANWLGAAQFSVDTYLTVNAWCICGPKLPELAAAGKYVHTGTILDDRVLGRGRRAAEATTDAPWQWPDAADTGPVDAVHGDHWSVPNDRCFAHIMSFAHWQPPDGTSVEGECSDYLERTALPAPLVGGYDPANPQDTTLFPYCTADDPSADAPPQSCCVVNRGLLAEYSRVWYQTSPFGTTSATNAYGTSSVVGASVHTSEVATVGDFVSAHAPSPLRPPPLAPPPPPPPPRTERRRAPRHRHRQPAVPRRAEPVRHPGCAVGQYYCVGCAGTQEGARVVLLRDAGNRR